MDKERKYICPKCNSENIGILDDCWIIIELVCKDCEHQFEYDLMEELLGGECDSCGSFDDFMTDEAFAEFEQIIQKYVKDGDKTISEEDQEKILGDVLQLVEERMDAEFEELDKMIEEKNEENSNNHPEL